MQVQPCLAWQGGFFLVFFLSARGSAPIRTCSEGLRPGRCWQSGEGDSGAAQINPGSAEALVGPFEVTEQGKTPKRCQFLPAPGVFLERVYLQPAQRAAGAAPEIPKKAGGGAGR